jgi:hypothetical protein
MSKEGIYIMRKLLLASVFALVPFAVFAHGPVPAGDTSAGSVAIVTSEQGTGAHAQVNGQGAVVVGAVSGNYTNVQANGKAGMSGTSTSAQQVNVGGTMAGGISSGDASGKAGGGQNSTAYGKATAKIGGNTRH